MSLRSPSEFKAFANALAAELSQRLVEYSHRPGQQVVFKNFTELPDRVAGAWQLQTQTPPFAFWQENPGRTVEIGCYVAKRHSGEEFDVLWLAFPTKGTYPHHMHFDSAVLQGALRDGFLRLLQTALLDAQELSDLFHLARSLPQIELVLG